MKFKSSTRAGGLFFGSLFFGLALSTLFLNTSSLAGECGVRSPGYWKNHSEAWAGLGLTLDGQTYTQEEVLELLWTDNRGDKWLTLFRAFNAARLNVALLCPESADCLVGLDSVTVGYVIEAAEAWLANYSGSVVPARTVAWQGAGEDLYLILDAYNNGRLCAPKAD